MFNIIATEEYKNHFFNLVVYSSIIICIFFRICRNYVTVNLVCWHQNFTVSSVEKGWKWTRRKQASQDNSLRVFAEQKGISVDMRDWSVKG